MQTGTWPPRPPRVDAVTRHFSFWGFHPCPTAPCAHCASMRLPLPP
ncbi:hypothetical protein [Lysobacter gummosus]